MRGRDRGDGTRFFVAAEEATRIEREVPAVLDASAGVDWYQTHGSAVDVAAAELCRLRRARAGERGATSHGDDAVRAILTNAQPEALVWLASRAISYMDETGFPEAVEPWLPDPYRE
jgi:hypothetical protein